MNATRKLELNSAGHHEIKNKTSVDATTHLISKDSSLMYYESRLGKD